ncbi:MAG: hypothetical protein AB1689_26230, partial [Thermodesulfobacteriota bacterium]
RESSERSLCVAAQPGAPLASWTAAAALRCHRARGPRLVPQPEVLVTDAFEQKRLRLRALRSVCAPVGLDGAEPASDELLACYDAAQAPGEPAFRAPGVIALATGVAAEEVTLRNGQRTVCVPAELR